MSPIMFKALVVPQDSTKSRFQSTALDTRGGTTSPTFRRRADPPGAANAASGPIRRAARTD